MQPVLRGPHWTTCVIYLDYIICMGQNFDHNLQILTEVLTWFRQAGLKLNPKKFEFCKSAVQYMGHIVLSWQLPLVPVNSRCICEWPVPRSNSEVAFLGLCFYYKHFIQTYALVDHLLHRLTQKHIVWMDRRVFNCISDIKGCPHLHYCNGFSQPFILSMDVSNYAFGAVLSQVENGKEGVIVYARHVLTRTEKKWSTYDKELWTIVWSVRHFRHYLSCNTFTIITDHCPLLSLKKLDVSHDPTERSLDFGVGSISVDNNTQG